MHQFKPAVILLTLAVAVLVVVISGYGPTAQGAQGQPTACPADQNTTSTSLCQIGGRQVGYSQVGSGLTIGPLRQDLTNQSIWSKTWRISGKPGTVVNGIQILTYRCTSLGFPDPGTGYDLCDPDKASITYTHSIDNIVIPGNGNYDLTIEDPASCCERDQSDLKFVENQRWGSSFFLRWANSPTCKYKAFFPLITKIDCGWNSPDEWEPNGSALLSRSIQLGKVAKYTFWDPQKSERQWEDDDWWNFRVMTPMLFHFGVTMDPLTTANLEVYRFDPTTKTTIGDPVKTWTLTESPNIVSIALQPGPYALRLKNLGPNASCGVVVFDPEEIRVERVLGITK